MTRPPVSHPLTGHNTPPVHLYHVAVLLDRHPAMLRALVLHANVLLGRALQTPLTASAPAMPALVSGRPALRVVVGGKRGKGGATCRS